MRNVCGGPLPNLKVPKTHIKDFIQGTYYWGGTSIPTSKKGYSVISHKPNHATSSICHFHISRSKRRMRKESLYAPTETRPSTCEPHIRDTVSFVGPTCQRTRLRQHVAPRRLPVTLAR
ncbi:hypothetical protein PanWU01x14_036230 [Parasponia andersonii]|uniref:Uncharacterized protein n=1 Tax=Parasponia andersonii TaxID=3476 RepID=A0A2P5DSD5_PARAD|nr:hypothetical protein PanWU01x14_036230 [Parasponia andersonii]